MLEIFLWLALKRVAFGLVSEYLATLSVKSRMLTDTNKQPVLLLTSSAIADRPRWRVGQFWPKVEDRILQTI